MKRKNTQVSFSKIRELLSEGKTFEQITKELGCSRSTVYRAKRGAQNTQRYQPKQPTTPTLLSISLTLPSEEGAEIKIYDNSKTMIGTVVIEKGGLTYKRPNQKIVAQRISWQLLERLTQLGFVQ